MPVGRSEEGGEEGWGGKGIGKDGIEPKGMQGGKRGRGGRTIVGGGDANIHAASVVTDRGIGAVGLAGKERGGAAGEEEEKESGCESLSDASHVEATGMCHNNAVELIADMLCLVRKKRWMVRCEGSREGGGTRQGKQEGEGTKRTGTTAYTHTHIYICIIYIVSINKYQNHNFHNGEEQGCVPAHTIQNPSAYLAPCSFIQKPTRE